MGLINAVFGTYSERQIKKIKKLAREVDALSDKYSAMSNDELRGITVILKERHLSQQCRHISTLLRVTVFI